jgi:hypothetical protein
MGWPVLVFFSRPSHSAKGNQIQSIGVLRRIKKEVRPGIEVSMNLSNRKEVQIQAD